MRFRTVKREVVLKSRKLNLKVINRESLKKIKRGYSVNGRFPDVLEKFDEAKLRMLDIARKLELDLSDVEGVLTLAGQSGFLKEGEGNTGKVVDLSPKKKVRLYFNAVSNALFWAGLLALVVYFITQGGSTRSILGYHFFTISTGSMRDVYPINTLIMVKDTPPRLIGVGDDITFVTSQTTSTTHRVIKVLPPDGENKSIAFITKGVNNPDRDKEPVVAANVVGVVHKSFPKVGNVIATIKENLLLISIWFVILLLLFPLMTYLLKELFSSKKETPNKKDKAKKLKTSSMSNEKEDTANFSGGDESENDLEKDAESSNIVDIENADLDYNVDDENLELTNLRNFLNTENELNDFEISDNWADGKGKL